MAVERTGSAWWAYETPHVRVSLVCVLCKNTGRTRTVQVFRVSLGNLTTDRRPHHLGRQHGRPTLQTDDGAPVGDWYQRPTPHGQNLHRPPPRGAPTLGGTGVRTRRLPRRSVPLGVRHRAVSRIQVAAGAPGRGARTHRRAGGAARVPQLRDGSGIL